MTGVIENMPLEARIERMRAFADVLLKIVREHGAIGIMDALKRAAATLRTAISQIKYGLNYALNNSILRMREDNFLVPAAA